MSRLFKACSLCRLASWGRGNGQLKIRFTSMVNKILKGANPQTASRATEEVRVRHQSECGQANRPDDSAQRAGAGGQGHQIAGSMEQRARSRERKNERVEL